MHREPEGKLVFTDYYYYDDDYDDNVYTVMARSIATPVHRKRCHCIFASILAKY